MSNMRKSSSVVLALTILIGLGLMVAVIWPGGAQAAKAKKLKLAACYSTPIEEPWPNCINQACLKIAKETGIKYDMTEHIGYTDFEKVLREYSERGYDIITGDAFGNEEVVRRVAKDYPKIAFCFGSGLGPAEPNFAVFDNWIQQPAYLCGIIGASVTKTGIIGALPQMDIPEVNRILNAYIAGAKATNPKVKVIGAYIGSFFDPPKNKEAGIALIEGGADVIFAMGYGGIEAAKEKKKLAFGMMQDQWELAPDSVITGPIWDMYPTIKALVDAVQNGYFSGRDYGEYSYMTKGGSYLAPYHNFEKKLPQALKDLVEAKKKEILDGKLRIAIAEATAKFDTK